VHFARVVALAARVDLDAAGPIAAAWPPAGAGVEKRIASSGVSAVTVSVTPGGR
jgi:hypothetical protein